MNAPIKSMLFAVALLSASPAVADQARCGSEPGSCLEAGAKAAAVLMFYANWCGSLSEQQTEVFWTAFAAADKRLWWEFYEGIEKDAAEDSSFRTGLCAAVLAREKARAAGH